jgi:uncharacterized membrane protein
MEVPVGNLGIVEILLILIATIPGLIVVIGGILGIVAFFKVRRIESTLKAKGLI